MPSDEESLPDTPIRVACGECETLWIDRGGFQQSYRKWEYCPLCGAEVTKSEKETFGGGSGAK